MKQNNTKVSKVNHLLRMNDMKVTAEIKQLDQVRMIVEQISTKILMQFGMDKGPTINIIKEKLQELFQ